MKKTTTAARRVQEGLKRKEDIVDFFIAIILAIVSVVSVPQMINDSKITFLQNIQNTLSVVVTLVIAVSIFVLYLLKWEIIKSQRTSELDYRREVKINEINQGVFNSLYDINGAKIRSIFRPTYGGSVDWNPIDYRENVLVYDIHEHIRTILISIKECIIRMDPERLNDINVSVDLVYCYPQDVYTKDVERSTVTDVPIQRRPNPWRLISSGDFSGNRLSVLDYLYKKDSFFALVDCCGTVFLNHKYNEIPQHMLDTIQKHLNVFLSDEKEKIFFVSDVRDVERGINGKKDGSAIGAAIVVRNDNPETMFAKAILTINTYGVPLFEPDTEKNNPERDKFGLTEDDYKNIITDTILATYSKLLESELAQMYIRHAVRGGNMNPHTGGSYPLCIQQAVKFERKLRMKKCRENKCKSLK